jgi:hypothetical protein
MTPALPIPLSRAVLCLDCSVVFPIGRACPTCAGEAWMPLSRISGARETRGETA